MSATAQKNHAGAEQFNCHIASDIDGIVLAQQSLSVTKELTQDGWREAVRRLVAVERGAQWWLGDLLAAGAKKYGTIYDDALTEPGYSYGYLRNLRTVALRVRSGARNPALPWAAHCHVARFHDAPEVQKQWLARAAENGWTPDELRKQIDNPPKERPTAFTDPEASGGKGGDTKEPPADGATTAGGDDDAKLVTCPNCGYEWAEAA